MAKCPIPKHFGQQCPKNFGNLYATDQTLENRGPVKFEQRPLRRQNRALIGSKNHEGWLSVTPFQIWSGRER